MCVLRFSSREYAFPHSGYCNITQTHNAIQSKKMQCYVTDMELLEHNLVYVCMTLELTINL